MLVDDNLFLDLAIVAAAAFLGGVGARLLHAPVVLGYLALGMIIGPHVLEIVENVDTVQTMAEIGVVLLVFTIGIEISFRDIYDLGRVVLIGGILQILATAWLIVPIGLLLGFNFQNSLLLGMVVSLSSTMVVLKTLSDRGELHSLHGRVLTGFLLVQDLAFIPMIAILPALNGGGSEALEETGLGLLKATSVLLGMVLLGTKVVPWVMDRITGLGSREIFILTVVATAFALAALTDYIGLSAALGAFVAGLLLSESDFGHRALSEVAPLRDIFAALFFASLGMLTDPMFVVDNYVNVLSIIGSVVVLKFVITTVLVRAFGYLPNTAVLSGLGMTQIGEFSFILVAAALTLGVVDQEFHSLVVVSAVLTMAVAPMFIGGGTRAVASLSQRVRLLRPYRLASNRSEERPPHLSGHVIICGLGRVGSLVAQAFQEYQVPFIAIDLDPRITNHWRNQGHFTIHGSSGSVEVLTAARIQQASILVISTGDPVLAYVTAQHALQLRPDLDIVARVHWRDEGERLQALGVGEVVWPQMEAGLEILRHSLYRYRKSRNEVDEFVGRLREHLSFTLTEDVEDILPPEGIGPAPEFPAPDSPAQKAPEFPAPDPLAQKANEAPEPEPLAEETAPQSSGDS
jgi:CPA2 family monovalent cation:H+ antiporter-2